MADAAYWLSPSGDIIPVDELHITMVLKNPEKFRRTKKELQEVYDKHKEPYGLEGKARAEIMSDIIKDGWIRVRYVPRNDFFTAQVNRLNEKTKEALYSFASQALEGIKGQKFSEHTEIKISNTNGENLETITLAEAKKYNFKTAKILDIKDYGGFMEIKFSFNMQRLVQHVKENNFGVVSAFLGKLDKKENIKRHKELKEKVKSLGYGYKELKGFWKGKDNVLEEEYSLFIPKISFEDISKLGKDYEQEAIIYGNSSEDDIILFSPMDSHTLRTFSKIETNSQEAWSAYSKLKNKSFKFSEVDYIAAEPHERDSFMGAIINESWYDLNSWNVISEKEDQRATITKKTTAKLQQ